jgi:radical SAM enzyme (TIGR01210 family)
MTSLQDWLRGSRTGIRGRKRKGPVPPVSVWREQELLGDEVVDTLVAVLATRGCSHERDDGGCSMCGYAAETPHRPPSEEELLAQVEKVASQRGGARWVKLYTSGSMLDPEEVPPGVVDAISRAFGDVDMLTVESRAEHITADRVRALGDPGRTEVAIGLESACDDVLAGSINKEMTLADFRSAASRVTDAGASVRAYVLLKPPFLTESEAIDDALEAVMAASDAGASVVSVNPVNIHGGTLVDHLHHRGEYEPPWLWSVVEVLRRADEGLPESTRVMSSPTAGGRPRGAHNCGTCDEQVLRAVEFHRLGDGPGELERVPDCDCRTRWRAQLDLEGFLQGPFAPRGYRRT